LTLPGLELRPQGHPARSQSLYRLLQFKSVIIGSVDRFLVWVEGTVTHFGITWVRIFEVPYIVTQQSFHLYQVLPVLFPPMSVYGLQQSDAVAAFGVWPGL
jgi:hypothetical protein